MRKLGPPIIGALIAGTFTLTAVYFTVFYKPPQTVEGMIRDSTTNRPIGGVTVVLKDKQFVTGDDGRYVFEKAIKPGHHRILAKKEGYSDFSGIVKVIDEGVVYDLTVTSKDPQPMSSPAAEVTIDRPKSGEQVGQNISISGRVSGPTSDRHLWLVVHPVGSLGWWPQGSEFIPDPSDGSWEVPVTIGDPRDIGKRFEVAVISATDNANDEFGEYLREGNLASKFPEQPLPQGARILAKVTVVRR